MAEKKSHEKDQLTKYERARLLGSRALQISMGAPFMVKLSDKELQQIKYDPLEIAKLELEKGVLPMKVQKILPGTPEEKKQQEQAVEAG
ncbi:DNA-directed RNA polymerase subunit K [Candidatus Woesearchaeota archaeon]|nr:DNA-directed RNA polymerase subunit K [Candidatus Woesearchaeota archaeon]